LGESRLQPGSGKEEEEKKEGKEGEK